MRATVRAGTDELPRDNEFHFALSPSRPVSVLLIQAEGAPPLSSLYPDHGALHRRGAAVQDGCPVAVARDGRELREALARHPERHLHAVDRRPTTR